jgi:hypothetical protein
MVKPGMENKVFELAGNFSLFKGDFKEKRFQLFNIESGSIFKLNEVSYDMLSLFDGEKNLEGVFNELKKLYNVEDEQLRDDLYRLVDRWIEKEILVLKEEEG